MTLRPVQRLGIAALGAAAYVTPRIAGRIGYDIFCTPPTGLALDEAEKKLAAKLTPLFDEAEPHHVATSDASVHAYRWRTEQSPSRGQVLLIHGWTAQAMVMGLFVKPLLSAGFDVVAIDLPGHGKSTGNRLSMLIGANAVLALDAAIGPFAALVTHSFGGLVASLAVEGGSPIARGIATDRLVLIAAPNSLRLATKQFSDELGFGPRLHHRLEREIESRARRPIEDITAGKLLAKAGKPVLLIHDRDDDAVAFSEAEAIVATTNGLATLEPTTGLGHRRIVVMPHVVRRTVRFLAE